MEHLINQTHHPQEVAMRLCRGCGHSIPDRRLQAVPTTVWCLTCAESRVELLGGNTIYEHKTGGYVEVKPISEAQTFARKTRRLCYNACLGLSGIGHSRWADEE
jgi:Prokaryotic dksA/traR C4-type zinc finger